MANPQNPAASPDGASDQVSGDMISILMPKELVTVLIQILQAADQKGASDLAGGTPPEDSGLSGLGDELSGSSRAPMQAVPR